MEIKIKHNEEKNTKLKKLLSRFVLKKRVINQPKNEKQMK